MSSDAVIGVLRRLSWTFLISCLIAGCGDGGSSQPQGQTDDGQSTSAESDVHTVSEVGSDGTSLQSVPDQPDEVSPDVERVREILKQFVSAETQRDTSLWESADAELAAMGLKSVPGLIDGLTSDSQTIREQASARLVQFVEHIEDREAMVPALSDESIWVRVHVASALSFSQEEPEQVVPALAELLNSSDANIQQQAVVALGNYGVKAEEATSSLARLLTHTNPEIRQAAASTLGAIGTSARSALPELQRVLAESDDETRRKAERAIQLIQFEEETPEAPSDGPSLQSP